MDKKIISIVAFIAILAVLAGFIWYEEERMVEGNWRVGTNFAKLEVGDNLTIAGISLAFAGETSMNCKNFPLQAQKDCKDTRFFIFYPGNGSIVPFKIFQGSFGAYVALEGTEKYSQMNSTGSIVIVSSKEETLIDSSEGSYHLRYDGTPSKGVTEFKIIKLF